MKKSAIIVSALTAVLTAGSMAVPAFAASNPADNARSYSYNTGRQVYEARMAEESAKSSYGYAKGQAAYQQRHASFGEED